MVLKLLIELIQHIFVHKHLTVSHGLMMDGVFDEFFEFEFIGFDG